MKKYSYYIKNLDCAKCASKIEQALQNNSNLQNVVVNFNTLKLSYQSETSHFQEIQAQIQQIEPGVLIFEKKPVAHTSFYFSYLRLGLGLLCAFLAFFLKGIGQTVFLLAAYIILLSRTFWTALKMLWKSHSMNENFLVFISCVGAYLIGEQQEGLMVIVLYEIGKILEEKAVHKTRKSIEMVMDIKPEYANIIKDETLETVLPSQVQIGDRILVKKGEKIPLDGIVVKGSSTLDVKALTGESKPQNVTIGSTVLSGSINLSDVLELKVQERYENSTVSRILELVENATDHKAKMETFVSKGARIYTPIIVLCALLVAFIMPLVWHVTYEESIYKALTFLVVSCPCAIAISVPLSYFSGIGRASMKGILIKGSDYLDGLRQIEQIVFDKTGTLTTGTFAVSEIIVYDKTYQEKQVLDLIAKAETFSTHPIAHSILNSLSETVDTTQVKEIKEVEGKGLSYQLNGDLYLVGNASFVGIEEMDTIGTIIYLKRQQQLLGAVVLADQVKKEAAETIQLLHHLHIKTKMLTGDNESVAATLAKQLKLEEYQSQMLPTDKYQVVKTMIEEQQLKVAFVGDGVNDAPVLALSHIGISMGGVGSASAIEASDIVIMNDDLRKIPEAIYISQYTNHIIKQNLIFAIGIKVTVLMMSILGVATMWQAVFADVGVTVLTILNTLRILKK